MSFSCVLLLELETRSYLFVSQNMLRAAAVFFFVSTAAAWIAPSGMLVRHHSCRPSALNWGPYGEKAPSEEEPTSEVDDTYKKPAGITAQSLFELIALGAGAPNLGKFKGVDKVSSLFMCVECNCSCCLVCCMVSYTSLNVL